jgi:hypothetical protein
LPGGRLKCTQFQNSVIWCNWLKIWISLLLWSCLHLKTVSMIGWCIKTSYLAGRVAQAVVHLPSKWEALSSNSSATIKKKKSHLVIWV